MSIQGVRPKNRREFMNELIDPYDKKQGNPNQVFSEPAKLGQPENNRALEMSVKGDTEKDFYIGIKDIDEAVMYYFQNVLKLSVVQNNTRINVPILYGSPENWKSVQQDGYYRDANGKLMAPLLMFKRKSVTQNRNLGNKLDGNLVHNIQSFETRFNKRNFYSNFSVLNNRVPESKRVISMTPDYVTIDYECIIWTYFVEQMDKLIESVNFASRSYWGDPNRFQFLTNIESFEDSITYDVGDNRYVKTNFSISLNGYLIPDTINKKLLGSNLYYGVSQVVFGIETSNTREEFGLTTKKAVKTGIKPATISDSVNNVNYITNISGVDSPLVTYLNTNKTVVGTYISSTTGPARATITFANGWLAAPTPLPNTSVTNFTFFINGAYVEPTSIVSFTESGGSSILILNTELDPPGIGYGIDSNDLIIAIGKFS